MLIADPGHPAGQGGYLGGDLPLGVVSYLGMEAQRKVDTKGHVGILRYALL